MSRVINLAAAVGLWACVLCVVSGWIFVSRSLGLLHQSQLSAVQNELRDARESCAKQWKQRVQRLEKAVDGA